MLRQLIAGAAAGAVGTVALNAASYTDMVIRGRPASELPGKVASQFVEDLGHSIGTEPLGADGEKAQNRQTGLGALMGYTVGVGVGAAYGIVRPWLPQAPLPLIGVGLGLAAMAASDVPLVKSGATDPRTWGASGWAADLVPHLAYGLAAAAAYDAFGEE